MAIKMHMPPLASVRGQTLLTGNKPYLYRQSPVVAEMLDDMLTGGTVAWNQYVPDPTDMHGLATKAFPSGTQFVQGHKLLVVFDAEKIDPNGATPQLYVYIRPTQSTVQYFRQTGTKYGVHACPLSLTASGQANVDGAVWMYVGNIANTSLKSINLIDLTQMFGSTIADHVYTLEQSTAGSGIAWLKSFGFFTEDYYPYDSGSLLSVKTSGHKVTGFNLFDKSTASADTTWTTSGTQGFSSGNTSSALIRVVPSASYFVGFAGKANVYGVYEFDASQNYIGRTFAGALTPRAITLPSNCYYVGLVFDSSRLDTACFNLSDADKNGTYQPYTAHTYPLSDIELRGIPKLTDGQMYYDGDTYKSDGTVTRKYGIRAYQAGDESDSTVITDKTNTVYLLATPTTETTDSFTNPQQAGSTEEYIDTRTVPMPVGHTTEYFNMEQKEQIQMHMPTHSPIKMHMEG